MAGGALDPQERVDALLVHLEARASGLSEREAHRRLAQFDPNEISTAKGARHARELVRQFVHPPALLLWVAAALSAVSGSRTFRSRSWP